MNREELFDIWVPAASPWSLWAKPVLFAHVSSVSSTGGLRLATVPNDGAIPSADGSIAIVVDLPGALGVALAMQLSSRGYRPVPLYNALPSATGTLPVPVIGPDGATIVERSNCVCDVGPIVMALMLATPDLSQIDLPASAPPAFILDATRRVGSGVRPSPGMFDNRSISLPTDFPSAARLLSQGIERVLLIQNDRTEPQEDLAHTLLRWQQGGVKIEAMSLESGSGPAPIQVTRPPRFRAMWHRMLTVVGLRRNPLGGFGGVLPMPSSSAG